MELVVTGEATELDIIPIVEADPSLADLAALRAEFDASILLPDEEVVTGKAPGDTQSCELDSGGPLALVNADGQWESYGVVSAGPASAAPSVPSGKCSPSSARSRNPFLEAERAGEDPCGEVAPAGQCRGDLLLRCESSFATGIRRLVEEDCSAAGAVCASTPAGAACE